MFLSATPPDALVYLVSIGCSIRRNVDVTVMVLLASSHWSLAVEEVTVEMYSPMLETFSGSSILMLVPGTA